MKKILLFSVLILLGFVGFAQPQHNYNLGVNARGDSSYIMQFGQNPIILNPNPMNNGFYNFRVTKNTQREMAYVLDTTTVGGTNDTTQIDFLLFGHSFFAQTQLAQQHFVQALESKFPSCGPGFIPVNVNKFQGTAITNTGWTIRTTGTVPFGRGLDLNEAISTASGTDFQIGTTAIYQNLDYNKWTNLDIYILDSTNYGSFTLTIDGVGQGTFNENAAYGVARIQIYGLANTYHSVDIHPTSTTNFTHLLGFKAYQRGVRGWMVSTFANSGTQPRNYLPIDSAMWCTQFGWLHPTTTIMNLTVNCVVQMDTVGMINSYDSLVRRIHSVDSNEDIVQIGAENIAASSGVPVQPFPAYNRTLYRLSLDSGWAFFDPNSIVPFSNIKAVTTGMKQSDSVHETPQASAAWVPQMLSQWGLFVYTPPPPTLTIYNSDYTLPSGFNNRHWGFNNGYLNLDTIQQFNLYGGATGAKPEFTINLSSTTSIPIVTGAEAINWDVPTFTLNNGAYISSAAAGLNSDLGYFQVGAAGAPTLGYTGFQLTGNANTSTYAIEALKTTGNSGYAGLSFLTPSVSGANYAGFLWQAGSTGVSGYSVQNNGITLGNNIGYIVMDAVPANGHILFLAGGNAYANEAMRIGSGLVQIGDSAAHADADFAITSTTKGFLPPRMTLAQFTAISSPETSLHAVLTDSSGRLALWNGSKIVTYATTDMLGSSSTPTLQQVLTAGSTFTGANTITQANNALTIAGGQVVLGNPSNTRTWNPNTTLGGSIFSIQTGVLNDATTAASGTVGNVYVSGITSPTLSATNTGVVYTNAYTFWINASPVGGTNVTITNPYALGVTGNSLFQGNITANSINLTGSNDLTAQTTATTVTSYAVPGSTTFNTFRVGGYVTVTAVSSDVIQLQVTWTDETSTSRSQSFFVQGATTGIGATGAYAYSPIDIRVKKGTTITVATILTTGTGSITYDVGANITQLY